MRVRGSFFHSRQPAVQVHRVYCSAAPKQWQAHNGFQQAGPYTVCSRWRALRSMTCACSVHACEMCGQSTEVCRRFMPRKSQPPGIMHLPPGPDVVPSPPDSQLLALHLTTGSCPSFPPMRAGTLLPTPQNRRLVHNKGATCHTHGDWWPSPSPPFMHRAAPPLLLSMPAQHWVIPPSNQDGIGISAKQPQPSSSSPPA